MVLILGALALGLLLGLALGGSWRGLAEIQFRWWPLAFVGLVLQFLPVPSMPGRLDEWLSVGLLIASYVVLLVFVAANIRLPGFPLLAVGFALNAVVVSANGGMPVSEQAVRDAFGPGYESERQELIERGGRKHHLATEEDVLTPLADVIPLGSPINQVLSVGDIVWLAGTVWMIAGAMRSGASGGTSTVRPGSQRAGARRLDPTPPGA